MKNVKELLTFFFAFSVALIDSLKDKKITFTDFPKFISPLMSAGAAFEDINKIGEELKNMTPAERAELLVWVQENFDISNDKAEVLIEFTIDHFVATYNLAVKWVAFKKA